MNKLKVKIKKLHPNVVIPSYSKEGDAGMDLTAVSIDHKGNYVYYKTGLAFEIPEGHVGLLFPRSSIRNYDLALSNSVGVIDAGYRGEIEVTFTKKKGVASKVYKIGDRICQLIILPFPSVSFVEADELSETERGSGGFGSTGTS